MKNIKNQLFLFALLIVAEQGLCQRDVVLVHGFGDNSSAWGVYRPFLQNFLGSQRANVFTRGYNSTQGVQSGVNQIAFTFPNSQRIAVGQSMGGIILRSRDEQQPNRDFGGIITLGSPNRGGVVLNAIQSGTVQAELQDGCQEITQAVGAGIAALSFQLPIGQGLFFGSGTSIAIFSTRICGEVINDLNNKIPTDNQSVTDLSEGSPFINAINSANTPTFKIGIFGVENSPVHMRVLSSLRNDPFAQPLGVDNTDQELVDLFHTVNDVVSIASDVFTVGAIIYSVGAIWYWPSLIRAATYAWAAYEFSDAGRWLAQSESKWHAVIGAGGFFTERVAMRDLTDICRQQLDDAFSQYEQQQISREQWAFIRQFIMSDLSCFEDKVFNIPFPINNQSDGLFNAGTERIPNDPFDQTHVINLQVDGVNHREFYNHRNMTEKFQQIFRGETEANPFFKLF